MMLIFFFKQKTAYDMRISDWSSDVCSSDLEAGRGRERPSSRAGRCQGRTVEAETGTPGAVELGASPTGFSLGCLNCGRTSWVASTSDSGEACAKEGGKTRPGPPVCTQTVGLV